MNVLIGILIGYFIRPYLEVAEAILSNAWKEYLKEKKKNNIYKK